MQETPHKTSQQIDSVIDRLNTRWDLQIPRLHGGVAVKAGTGSDLARKCSSRIRALCWKDNVNMESVLDEFEDKVKHEYSHWICKPSQQDGTLLSLPSTKSFLHRDALSKSRNLSPKRRHTFLEVFSSLLEEEYKLAADSDFYQRTPSESVRDSPPSPSLASQISSTPGSFSTAPERHANVVRADIMKNGLQPTFSRTSSLKKREASRSTTASSKRAKTASTTSSTKREKGQQSLSQMIKRQSAQSEEYIMPNPSSIQTSFPSEQNIQSFTTHASEEPESVFSDAEFSTIDSNATSFMSLDDDALGRRFTDVSGTQYSGETDVLEAFNEDVNRHRSIVQSDVMPMPTPTPVTTLQKLEKLLIDGPFNLINCPLPKDLPYWYRFELYRIGQELFLEVGFLWKKTRTSMNEPPSFAEFWKRVKLCYQEIKNVQPLNESVSLRLPAKSNIPDWVVQDNKYCDQDSRNSISLSAKLDFSKKQLLEFRLKPIQYGQSCRFHRHFGADRFLTIDMPYFDQRSLPAYLKADALRHGNETSIHESAFRLLTTESLHIAGREWRAFWVEPIKPHNKKRRKEERFKQRIHFFAVDGFDFNKEVEPHTQQHQPMNILDFMRWHLPLERNGLSTDMKLFARFQLGLSKTLPTVVLERHEFIQAPDIPAQDKHGRRLSNGTIMTDGCARMSYKLACAVWAQHEKPGVELPSAFQARIAGAKGLWHVDYSDTHPNVSDRGFWIEIRDSQLKIQPHPAVCKDADESQRTFEVVRYSSPCNPGHLNIQLINIMHYCGVSRDAFRDVLHEDLAEYLESLRAAMHDPKKLLVWLQANHSTLSDYDAVDFCGGMPKRKEVELKYMVESGFLPASCLYLSEGLRSLIKQALDTYIEKLHINVENSTTVFCIPDPLGVLAPGEIQLNFSRSKIDPRTGFPESYLETPQVLVARNPAHLASDVQLVKAVYHHELRYLKDVIIFPVNGQYPLADLLSGGDYDGDTVMVMWDPKLTTGFRNRPKPKLASVSECGLKSQTRLVREVFDIHKPSLKQFDTFMHACCSFNGHQSRLGEVTIEHESLVYNNLRFLGEPTVEKLGALAGLLVDGAKQGHYLPLKRWHALQKQIRESCGIQIPKEPMYKEGSQKTPRRRGKECVNIIDYLKFDVAEGLSDATLIWFHNEWVKGKEGLDEHVLLHYRKEQLNAAKLAASERKAAIRLFDDLSKQIRAINTEWQRRCGRDDPNDSLRIESRNKAPQADYSQVLRELTDEIHAIEPLNIDCDIRREFMRDGGGKGTRWSLLRAAFTHVKYSSTAMAWKLVGDELCTIKARAHPCGRTWEMTLLARQIMRADVKRYKRIHGDDDGDDGVNDDYNV